MEHQEFVGGTFDTFNITSVAGAYVAIPTGPPRFPLDYRIAATTLHVLIFVLGVVGNILTIYVALRTKSLQLPTYRYFVSLAFGDLLVLLSAVPEAIVFHNFGRRWMAGQFACSLLVFTNFLGINAGSISIFAFTVEIYIAICRPLVAKRFCTLDATNKIILGLWIMAGFYCSPWLVLTEVKPDLSSPPHKICDFRLSKNQYVYYFVTDLILFYLIPLLTAVVIYSQIVHVLHRSVSHHVQDSNDNNIRLEVDLAAGTQLEKMTDNLNQESDVSLLAPGEMGSEKVPLAELTTGNNTVKQRILHQELNTSTRIRYRAHVLRMLIVVVILFAIAWLPYRGLLIYNTFLDEAWLNLWYLLFAKTFIYLNSAMNPFLYSAMSRRFRQAIAATLRCRNVSHDEMSDGTIEISLYPTTNNLHPDTDKIQQHNNGSTAAPIRDLE